MPHKARVEVHRFAGGLGSNDYRLGNLFGGRQEFLHQERRKREDIADIVEPVAAVIRGKIIGRPQVDANEISNGVVVLFAVEPPKRHMARVMHLTLCAGKRGVHPGDDLIALRGCKLRRAGGRHVA